MRTKLLPLLLCIVALLALPLPVLASTPVVASGGAQTGRIVQLPEESTPEPPSESSTPEPPPPVVEAKYRIIITPPSGWYTKTATVTIRLEDVNHTGFTKAEAKMGQNGKWQDVTEPLTDGGRGFVDISDNGTVYVAVTDATGKAHVKSLYIECFDRESPTVKAKINGKTLHAEADDALSGVAAIYVGGYKFDDLQNGSLDLRVKEYVETDEPKISVYAVDDAGNRSKTVNVKNPYYIDASSRAGSSAPDKAPQKAVETTPAPGVPPASQPSVSAPSAPVPKPEPVPQPEPSEPDASAESKPFTPDGTGSVLDNAAESDGKEFFTITTESDNIFYLVIDRQRDSDGVYLLNTVTEDDLMALSEKSAPTQSAIPEPEPEPIPAPAPVPGPEPEPAPPPADSNTGSILFIILAALAAGGAGYYFKVLRPRQQQAQDSEEEDYDDGWEEDPDEYMGDDSGEDREEGGSL